MGAQSSKQAGDVAVTRFVASYAPTDRATCKKCGKKIEKGSVRLTREVGQGFGSQGIALHYHGEHGLEAAAKVKCATAAPAVVTAALKPADAKKWQAKFAKLLAGRAKKCGK